MTYQEHLEIETKNIQAQLLRLRILRDKQENMHHYSVLNTIVNKLADANAAISNEDARVRLMELREE